MRGYKAFNKDLTCRGFQYEIGKTYEMDGEIEICRRGFHFCENLSDCYNFYEMWSDTRICEVEALGEIKSDNEVKYCTNKIKILSEVEKPKEKSNVSKTSMGYCNSGTKNNGNRNSGDLNWGNFNSGSKNVGHYNAGVNNKGNYNTGRDNEGNGNSGSCNYGYRNTGGENHGDFNSGDRNEGHYNTGSDNRGNYNSGRFNRGNNNTGYHNIGYFNSGDYNVGNNHAGVFNCEEDSTIKMFDKESNWTMHDWVTSRAYRIMLRYPLESKFFNAGQLWWDDLDEDDKNAVKALPNFDADKFYLCTGIRVTENNTKD